MHWFRIALFVLVAAILQASKLLDLIAFTHLNIRPDLLLILLVFFATHCRTYQVIIISFVLGLAADIAGGVMGTHMISFGLFGLLLKYVHNIIMIRKMLHQAVAIFLTGLLAGALVQLLAMLKDSVAVVNLFWWVFGTSLYSAVIGPYICSLLLPTAKWLGIKKYRLDKPSGR